ncbi:MULTISPECIES: hypothetical protein [unclassified Clostridium]|uniref:hypothetical protein n=1 Tax=unclassified Clostridium TaxID=2614128 RepID=UPI00029758CC|nr:MULTISPECIES: hypothetical protein [unclassified Clostridium]EKQ53812.1 MAG: hypothetical protein A370_03558 [Clostridium sp. Maddingley MBC34-26]
MCTPYEKLILDSYVEGVFATDKLIEVIEDNSQILECEIYRGIFVPNFVLKIGNDINKYHPTKIMSFSKNIKIAKRFSQKSFIDEYVFNYLKRDGYNVNHYYKPNDNSFFSRVIIRLKDYKCFDLYAHYENKAYEHEKEVLVITEPLYIQAITEENDMTIVDCVNEAEFAKNFMISV